ncbi:hypothetical protein [Pseudobacter ginsenosidimutans]|uniref:YD repeat-containing protein n=1 Tax=Pseudobacter ginsenosidimutans TaxID=661488 RepID=A0A4Q7N3B2_9BACT|nr:hypothetical protein [Pseudobacter ginsenosidimutans]QEC43718.1 hypothetical protein FSB84_19275 [Pseudobacter ginsenosidimutans]RZS75125.1 YD repeat-containing protein [Pseudobacter ginsenosidimutans]
MNTKLFWIVVCLLAFAACSKSKDSAPPCNIITVNSTGDDPTTFTYNKDGKPVSINYGTYKTEFTYSGNTINILQTNNGVFRTRWIVEVNSKGLAEKIRNEHNAAGTDWTDMLHTYNGDQLQKIATVNKSGVVTRISSFTWEDGNPVLISYNNGDPAIRYEYYKDKPFDPKVFLVEGNYWDVARPKNLLKNMYYGDDLNWQKTYEFDSKGRVIAQTEKTGSSPTTYLYTYDCDR